MGDGITLAAKETRSPTPYAGVNAALAELLGPIRAILGSQFLGMYLYGSLALGDFDPQTSDIDFIAVTRGEISEDSFTALREMHARFDRSGSPWSGKIEAAYIPQEALKHAAATPARYPQIEKGTELIRAPLEIGWAFQRYTLRERGVIIAGPDPHTFFDPGEHRFSESGEMRRAAAAIMGGWLEQSRRDPAWVAWAHIRSSQAFIILTLCRLLYSLETGDVVSKPAAARWAQEALGARWDAAIRRALAGQHDEQEAPDSDYEDMLALLKFCLEGEGRQESG